MWCLYLVLILQSELYSLQNIHINWQGAKYKQCT